MCQKSIKPIEWNMRIENGNSSWDCEKMQACGVCGQVSPKGNAILFISLWISVFNGDMIS